MRRNKNKDLVEEALYLLKSGDIHAFNNSDFHTLPEYYRIVSEIIFSKHDLTNANLTNIRFYRCHFVGENFSEAEIEGSSFYECNLDDQIFQFHMLGSSSFVDCSMRRSNIQNLDRKRGFLLNRTRFINCDLEGSSLQSLDLRRSQFQNCNLKGVNFEKSNLESLNLDNANLSNANLKDVNFFRASLRNVNLTDATLNGADFTSSRYLSQEVIETAYGDQNTKLIGRLRYPNHWNKDASPVTIYPRPQIPAPVHFHETEDKVDVSPPSQPAKEYDPRYKNSVFESFKSLTQDFAQDIQHCNISYQIRSRTEKFASAIEIELEQLEIILISNKFRSLLRLLKSEFDSLSAPLQFDLAQLENNFSVLEDMFPEARLYKKNSKSTHIPEGGIPSELQKIVESALASEEAQELLTSNAKERMKELEEEASSNDPDTIKDRAMGIITSFTNLMRVLENMIDKANNGVEHSKQLALKAKSIHTKAQSFITWANEILKNIEF